MLAAPLQRRAFLAGLGVAAFSAPAMAGGRNRDVATAGWADIELLDSEDRRFRVGDAGQPLTLVKLWANWCSVCLRELHAVSALQAELKRLDVALILVSHPADWRRNQALAQAHGLTARCARPSADNPAPAVQAALVSADGSFYVPRSLLYRESSQSVVWSHVGGIDWTEAGATDPIRRWVG